LVVRAAADLPARERARVCDPRRAALRARGGADPERRARGPGRAPPGRSLHRTADGGWWRAFPFIEGTHAVDTPGSPDQAARAAQAFGAFVADLADLDPARLAETIPRFHDLAARRIALANAARADVAGPAREVAADTAA